jgi:hypothetical protein
MFGGDKCENAMITGMEVIACPIALYGGRKIKVAAYLTVYLQIVCDDNVSPKYTSGPPRSALSSSFFPSDVMSTLDYC